MADDVLHAAVVEQDALVLEAGVAAHGGVAFDRFTYEAPLFVSWPCFTREASSARCFVPFGAA